MSTPKPPFHSATEELLYAIFQKLGTNTSTTMGLSASDINTLAKLNAIIVDADLVSTDEFTNRIEELLDGVPPDWNTLAKLYQWIRDMNPLLRSDLDTLDKLNDIVKDADLISLNQLDRKIQDVIGDAPAEGNTLGQLYLMITNLDEVKTTDIDSMSKLNQLIKDDDVASLTDLSNAIQNLIDNASEEGNSLRKLYDLIVTLQNAIAGLNGLKASDIDTLAEINNLIVDADVVSTTDLSTAVSHLEDLIANLSMLNTVIFNFNSNLFTEQGIVFQGVINALSQNFTDELTTVVLESSFDTNPKNWIGHADLNALQTWINTSISGTQFTGTKYWIRCTAIYKAGHTGQAQSLLTFRQT